MIKRIGLIVFLVTTTLALKAQVLVDTATISSRLSGLKISINYKVTPEVKQEVEMMLRNKSLCKEMLHNSMGHIDKIDKILKARNVPAEMKYLPAVLTNFINERDVTDGKTGIWNMPFSAARKYDLEITTYIDERMNPEQSTEAFAAQLLDLKKTYSDWLLAVSAYCNSMATINSAILQTGNHKNYWTNHEKLQESEKQFVNRFIAAIYVFNYYSDYGFDSPAKPSPVYVDSVWINKTISFKRISEAVDVSIESLRALNPIYRLDVIPYSEDPFLLLLPKGKAANFDQLLQNVPEANKPLNEDPVIVKAEDIVKPSPPPAKASTGGKAKVTYTVKKGETLSTIADLFDCRVSDVKKWNKLKSNTIATGRKLVFYVPASRKSKYAKINQMSSSQKRAILKAD